MANPTPLPDWLYEFLQQPYLDRMAREGLTTRPVQTVPIDHKTGQPKTVPVPLAGGTIQLPPSTQLPSGNYKTKGPPLAGSVPLADPNYRPKALPYTPPGGVQYARPVPPLPPVAAGNYGAGHLKAYNEQLLPNTGLDPALAAIAAAAPQPAALKATEVAANVPLPRARPAPPLPPQVPAPVPLNTATPGHASIAVIGGGASVPPPIPAGAILRGSATGKPYDVGKTYEFGDKLMLATPGGFVKVYDPTVIGSGHNLLGSMINHGIAGAQANPGGLLGMLFGGGGAGRPVAVSAGGNSGGSGKSAGFGFDLNNRWGDPAIRNDGF